MKIMETSVKNLSAPRALSCLLKAFVALRLNQIRIPSPNTLPYQMFTYGIPYEATHTYKNIRKEFETNKSVAIIEVQQALWRR